MGHQRLGDLPKTRKWSAVVTAVASAGHHGAAGGVIAEDVDELAEQTLDAAKTGLDVGVKDLGLNYTFYLLTQVALASREDDWHERLLRLGIHLSPDSSLFDLTVEMQGAIDDYVASRSRATDIGEMAQQAGGEALAELAAPNATTLFGSGSEQLQNAVRRLSTKAGFARLGQEFFGRFMSRFLNFYLSRATAGQVSEAGVASLAELSEFNEVLGLHCRQSAGIVRDFCGEWYSKTEYQEGIDLERAQGFVAIALRKLEAELGRQEEGR